MLYASIFWSIIFGGIGMGYLVYARQQRDPFALLSGIGLCIYPYFVDSTLFILLVGAALMALPFWFKV